MFFMLILFSCTSLSAQNIKRSYKLLEDSDYIKAHDAFREVLVSGKNNAAASFGMALLYADEKSPYFNLVESWALVRHLQPELAKLTQEEIEIIGDYFLNTETRKSSRPVKTKIEYAVSIIEAKLIKFIREENNLELVNDVIRKFPDFRHYDNVVHIRNQLEFRKYEKQHTLDGYLEFMVKFPDAAQVEKARAYINALAYEQAKQAGTVEAMKNYLSQHPGAKESASAVRDLHAMAFGQAKQANTLTGLEDFIAEYPDALEVAEARQIQQQLLYEHARKIQTLEAYDEFIRKYPEGQRYIDIFNLKSLDLGMKFLSAHPLPESDVLWARSFNKEGYTALPNSCLTSCPDGSWVIGANLKAESNGTTGVWIIKTDSNGKMLWNKDLNGTGNSDVRLLRVSPEGEIIGAGCIQALNDTTEGIFRLFKVSSDGRMQWSRTLGNLRVLSLLLARNGHIILGGYKIDDKLMAHYAVMVVDTGGRKLLERTYVGKGVVHSLGEIQPDGILLAGSRWIATMDNRGYLLSELPADPADSLTCAVVLPSGELAAGGLRNHKPFIRKITKANKPVFDKELLSADSALTVQLKAPSAGELMTGWTRSPEGDKIFRINTATGDIRQPARLPGPYRLTASEGDGENLMLLMEAEGQLLLIRQREL